MQVLDTYTGETALDRLTDNLGGVKNNSKHCALMASLSRPFITIESCRVHAVIDKLVLPPYFF